MIARAAALFLSLALWFGIGLDAASACSCERAPANIRGFEQQKAWEFARATNVVRGKIINVRAGDGVVRYGRNVVLFTMRVQAVLKGDVPAGDVTIVTNASSAMCGMGERLLGAAEGGSDISLELRTEDLTTARTAPGEFYASYCGYFLFGSDPNLSQR